MATPLPVGMQENLLSLVAFSASAAPIVRNTVDASLFGVSSYRDLATRCYAYIDEYRKPPGEHLPDLYTDKEIDGSDEGRERRKLIEALYEQREHVNESYVLNQLDAFVRQQTIKQSIIAASEALQEGELERAEREIERGLKTRVEAFAPGLRLAQAVRKVFRETEVRRDLLPIGIKEFDMARYGVARGEMEMLIGPPKKGKSWWLVYRAKTALMLRKRVLYLTLELSEESIAQRAIQSLLSISRRKAKVAVTRFKRDSLGRVTSWEVEQLGGRLSLDDEGNLKATEKKLQQLRCVDNLLIKRFPSNTLTVQGINRHLDMLERSEHFRPDVIIIDYPEYMKMDPRNFRIELGMVYDGLRGLAVERDVAMCVAKKSNRTGAGAKLVTDQHSAEDYSSIYSVDSILTYSQTAAEYQLGLARLFASQSRVAEKDKFVVLISQSYPVGQFCLDSAPMNEDYWNRLEEEAQNKRLPSPTEEADGDD